MTTPVPNPSFNPNQHAVGKGALVVESLARWGNRRWRPSPYDYGEVQG